MAPTWRRWGVVWAVWASAALQLLCALCHGEEGVNFSLRNLSGERIRVYWDGNGQLVPQTQLPIRNSSSVGINSFRGHRFLVWYAREDEEAGKAEAREHGVSFVVGDTNEVIEVGMGLDLHHDNVAYQALEAAIRSLRTCGGDKQPCLQNSLKEWLRETQAMVNFERIVYTKLRGELEEYQCTADGQPRPGRGTCTPEASETIRTADQELYDVNIHDPDSTLMPIEDTIRSTVDHCRATAPQTCQQDAVGSQAPDCGGSSESTVLANAEEASQGSPSSKGLLGFFSQFLTTKASGTPAAVEPPVDTAYAECLARYLGDTVAGAQRQATRLRVAKSKLSERHRNQTCLDSSLGTSGPDMKHLQWRARDEYPGRGMEIELGSGVEGGERIFEVTQLLQRNGAQVLVVDKFVSPEESAELMREAEPRLRTATVNEEGDNQAVSNYRRSQAANIIPKYNSEQDLAARVSRRVFAFTNAHTNYSLEVAGQEPFSVIQYLPGQEYRPHCDGSCDGSHHLHAGRVATMLMYLKVADEGGATTFTKSGVLITPRANQAVFFSYMGPHARMDTELTEHSGCPVQDGSKWVMTEWMRAGVSDQDPWSKFDPIGSRL